MHKETRYWLVVYSKETGDFKNTSIQTDTNQGIHIVSKTFESKHPEYHVIHIGEGDLPPKSYRSLEYITQ